MGSRSDAATDLLALALTRPPTLGTGRLVCIDGPAGSGKTTLAAELAALAPEGTVIHTDDLLEGWAGLPGLAASVEALLAPLAEGRPGRWRRWDWHSSAWAETREVPPAGLLILDGVGSWSPAIAPRVTALAWVEAAYDVRMARGLARDGEAFAPHWDGWAADEAALFAATRARDRADLVLVTG
jgi:energy-coupling factor transporter ATP-binding protein EcfA2